MFGKWRDFFKDLWILTRPYWFSEDRWPARGLLAVIVGMNLGLVYLLVILNEWNNLFYNALQDKTACVSSRARGPNTCAHRSG